jgi:hypothetical protein
MGFLKEIIDYITFERSKRWKFKEDWYNKSEKFEFSFYDKNGDIIFPDKITDEILNQENEFLKKTNKIQKKILSKKIRVLSKEQINDVLLKKRMELKLKGIDENLIDKKIKKIKKQIKLKNKKDFKKIEIYSKYADVELYRDSTEKIKIYN